jgi:hypothetical protein
MSTESPDDADITKSFKEMAMHEGTPEGKAAVANHLAMGMDSMQTAKSNVPANVPPQYDVRDIGHGFVCIEKHGADDSSVRSGTSIAKGYSRKYAEGFDRIFQKKDDGENN